MLRACLWIKADVQDNATPLRTAEEKFRVAQHTSADEIKIQMQNTFGLETDTQYQLYNDDELCSLPAMVASLQKWLEAGDPEAPIEYEGQVVANKAIVPLALKVLKAKTGQAVHGSATMTSDPSTETGQSVKRSRDHKEWQKEAWEVSHLSQHEVCAVSCS
jgi:hypothetical protein